MLPLNYYPESDLKKITQNLIKEYTKRKDKEILKKVQEIDSHLIERFTDQDKKENLSTK